MKNHSLTVEERIAVIERSAARWRFLTVALIGAAGTAALLGAGGDASQPAPAPGTIVVPSGGYVLTDQDTSRYVVVMQSGDGAKVMRLKTDE